MQEENERGEEGKKKIVQLIVPRGKGNVNAYVEILTFLLKFSEKGAHSHKSVL